MVSLRDSLESTCEQIHKEHIKARETLFKYLLVNKALRRTSDSTNSLARKYNKVRHSSNLGMDQMGVITDVEVNTNRYTRINSIRDRISKDREKAKKIKQLDEEYKLAESKKKMKSVSAEDINRKTWDDDYSWAFIYMNWNLCN